MRVLGMPWLKVQVYPAQTTSPVYEEKAAECGCMVLEGGCSRLCYHVLGVFRRKFGVSEMAGVGHAKTFSFDDSKSNLTCPSYAALLATTSPLWWCAPFHGCSYTS